MKIVIVSCSPFIDYVRARTLRQGFSSVENSEIIIVKNSKTGFSRYFEVFFKLLKVRFSEHPDIYVLTFRGYEMLLATIILSARKPFIFDEFINPIEWLIYEKHKIRPTGIIARLFIRTYKKLIKRVSLILADTQPHAEYSAQLNNLSLNKYAVVPVGTDESLFYPIKSTQKAKTSKFKIFYYGQNMTPLHGLSYILDAAIKLEPIKQIEFTIVGGGKNTVNEINKAIKLGAQIKYIEWIDFNNLPHEINKFDLCLGGPFGATVQSQLVITNKTTQFMACAKPVIVGKTKISNLFLDKKNCLIVNQGSASSIANKILWAYQNQKQLKQIGLHGYALYQENLSQNVINNDIANILNRLKFKLN